MTLFSFRSLRLPIGVLLLALLLGSQARGSDAAAPHFKAVAFDYFVIFDPNSIVPAVERVFPGKGAEFTAAWRSRQFDYCFLRSLTDNHADFFKVTGDALDYTAEQMHLELTPQARTQLLDAYLNLRPWPDTVAALKKLRAAGLRIITISNLSPEMLRANAEHAGIADLFDDLLSTEKNGTFKPDPRAYSLGIESLHLQKREIVFAAFGGWDAYGAQRFGYPTVWVNRFQLPVERLGTTPDTVTPNMTGLLQFALGPSAPEASASGRPSH